MDPQKDSSATASEETLSTFLFYFQDYLEKLSPEAVRSFAFHLKTAFPEEAHSAFFFFPQNRPVEFFRKALMRFGLCHDIISLSQKEITERISELRQTGARPKSLTLPKKGCRFLLRVDDFPSFFAPSESFPRFHEIARGHGIPYLLAVTPYLQEGGLKGSEIKMLQNCRLEGMTPALHGFTHKRIHPGISSELLGLPEKQLRESLKRASAYLKSLSLEPSVFVAPFNSYDPKTIAALTELFSILCGGPESVSALGYRGPSFLENSLYLPSYRGVYDIKKDFTWIEKIKAEGHGQIIPVTLHWANELKNDFSNFRQLCKIIQSQMMSWDDIVSLKNKILAAAHD